MDYSVNTRPLLQSETESDVDVDLSPETEEDLAVVTKDTRPIFKVREPQDRYHGAYVIFYFLGMTTLLPWCFFITANDYWMFKFQALNGTHYNGTRTPLQKGFTAYLSVASSVPSTLVLILNSFMAHKISIHSRMVGSLSVILALFVMTTALVNTDTDTWQTGFFYLTMTTVALLNIASAVLTGGLFGMLGKFSTKYISAASGGQAFGGVLAAISEIVSMWLGASPQHSAFVYFMLANGLLVMSIVLYVTLVRSMFYKFHSGDQPSIVATAGTSEEVNRTPSYLTVLSKTWVYGFAILFCVTVSLSVYPAVTVLVNSEYKGRGSKWSDVYFVPTVAYLLLSSFDYLGRFLAGIFHTPRRAWALALISLLRVIFIPLVMLCNAQPRTHLPVVFPHDYEYIIIIALFGFTNGYLTNMVSMSAPKAVNHYEQEMASTIVAAFLGIGLAFGSVFSIALVHSL